MEDNRQATERLQDFPYHLLLLHAEEAIVVVGSHHLLYANPAAERLMGYSTEELYAQPFFEFVVKDDRRAAFLEYRRILRGSATKRRFALRVVPKEDPQKWIEFAGLPITWKEETAVLGFIRDITQHKRTEHALRNSEIRYRTLMDQSTEMIYLSDTEGNILHANTVAIANSGYSHEELLSMSIFQLEVEPMSKAERIQLWQGLFPSEQGKTLETSFQSKTSTVYPVELVYSKVVMDGTECIMSQVRDVSDRKKMEAQLKDSEERFRNYVDNAPDGIFVFTNSGLFVEVNPAASTITGYPELELLGMGVYDLVAKENLKAIRALLPTLKNEKTVILELPVRCKDGTNRTFSVNAVRIAKDEYLAITRDITDKMQAEQELRAQKEILEGVINAISDVIGIQYPDHTIEMYNRAGYDLLGTTPEQIKGKTCYELLGRSAPCTSCASERALHSKKAESEEKYLAETGMYLNCTSHPVLDAEGNIIRIVEHLRDVTEIKEKELQLKKERDFVAQIFDAMNQYVIVDGMDHKIEFMNRRAKEDFGDLVGRTCYEEMGRVLPCPKCPIIEFEKDDTLTLVKYQLEAFGRILDASATKILNVDGSYSVLEVLEDVTERKQIEVKLTEYTTELELRELELDTVYQRLHNELAKARHVHDQLLHPRMPVMEELSLTYFSSSASYIGGDFFQIIEKGDLLILYLSDVTGHGLDGTMFSMFVKNKIEAFVDLASLEEITSESILRYLDSCVRKGDYLSEYAVAIFLLIIHRKTKKAQFSAAGFQNAPVMIKQEGALEFLVNQGLPITSDVPAEFIDLTPSTTYLPEGVLVLLSTDGLYEQAKGESFYEERLLEMIHHCNQLPKETLVDLIGNDFQQFLETDVQSDDVTFVVLSTYDPNTKRHRIPSTFDHLELGRAMARDYYKDRDDVEGLVIAIHEMLANAIEHGNKLDPTKVVHLVLSPKAIVIEDQGLGFDWQERLLRNFDLDKEGERGRGLMLTKMLTYSMVYNTKGNRVSIVLAPELFDYGFIAE